VIGSTVGREVSARNPVYGSTKFALHSLVESLRRAVSASGVRVTLIEPGFVRSGFQDSAGYDREWFADVERASGPLLVPDDVARVVRFVVEQPPHVHVDDIRLRPTRQVV
jgi:NADP-dependent 3-hydroxy acid dehydrogenase YdfG